MWIFPFILVFLHTNYYGKSIDCSQNKQCNYSIVQNKMRSNDTIFFYDKYIVEGTHLNSFRELLSTAISLGTKIHGFNTIINGTFSEHYFPAFLTVSGSSNSSIINFTFTQFKHSIFSFSGPLQCKIINFSFIDSSIEHKNSIFILENSSQIFFQYTNFTFLTADASTIFSFKSSFVEYDYCLIDNVFLFHPTNEFPIIEAINSSIRISNSVISRVGSPYGSLFNLKAESNMSMINSSLISNQNQYLIDCKDSHSLLFNNSIVYENQASFISTHSKKTEVIILNTCFEYNHSPLSSFITVQTQSLIKFDNNCKFVSNAGTFSLIRSLDSNIFIHNSIFEDNSFDDTIIKCTKNSQLMVDYTQFYNSQSKTAVIYLNHSVLSISKSNFTYSWSPSIYTESSHMNITQTVFDKSEAHSQISVISRNSLQSYIFNSSFQDETLTFSIEITGASFLQNLQFNTQKELALPPALIKKCHNCHFLTEKIRNEVAFQVNSSIVLMISLSFIIFVLIIFIFRKRFRQLFRQFRSQKIV